MSELLATIGLPDEAMARRLLALLGHLEPGGAENESAAA